MPFCCLQIYEKLEDIKKNKDYWSRYIDFYEDYWGGPPSPHGVWFGNEYPNFQESLSDRLSINKQDIKECLFIKENNEYYISLSGPYENNKSYAFLVDNVVPIHWFFLFSKDQKKTFKSHYGFGSIHYTNNLVSAQKKIDDFNLLNNSINDKNRQLFTYLNVIQKDLNEVRNWCSNFSEESKIILNYGDLLALFPLNALDKEDSVKIISDFKDELKKENYPSALDLIEFLISRWSNIEFANQKNVTSSTN